VRERVAAIDASPTAAAEVTSFDRGWFRSTARIELSFVADDVTQLADVAGDLSSIPTLPIAVDFAHGPVAVLDGVHFGWAKSIARADTRAPGVPELERTLGVPYLFEFRGRSGYLGGLTFDADAPPFDLPVDDSLVSFSGATLAGKLARNRLAADVQVGALEFTSATGGFAVRGLAATADNELRSDYVLPGKTSIEIASISAGDSSQGSTPLFEATQLALRSEVTLDRAEELLEMKVDYTADAVRIDDAQITGAALGLTARNVDVATLEAYGAAATDAAAAGDSGAIAAALGPHLERALKAAPSLTLDPVEFNYDAQPFKGRVELTTNTERLPPAGTLSLDNPLLMLGLMNADAELRVSKALAGELAKLSVRMQLGADTSVPPDQVEYMAEAQSGLMLTMLVGQGVLLEDGESYRSSLQFRDGTITLNGNTLPFGL
jgi:uncharacterized protein YdgA (DUF945 family)